MGNWEWELARKLVNSYNPVSLRVLRDRELRLASSLFALDFFPVTFFLN